MKQPTAGIILAAGESLRFGRPKLLAPLKGKRLIEWVLDSCLHSKLQHIVLVLGHRHQAILQALGQKAQHQHLTITVNSRYREGQSTSLRAGLLAAEQEFNSVMFVLGDQPIVTTGLIDTLLEKFWESPRQICAPVCRGRRGNPVLFSRRFYKPILALQGDVGARKIIEANPEEVLRVEIGNPLYFFDVDTAADLQTLESRILAAQALENPVDL
jgi:molybdenum cofactor cytidylyltransferase